MVAVPATHGKFLLVNRYRNVAGTNTVMTAGKTSTFQKQKQMGMFLQIYATQKV